MKSQRIKATTDRFDRVVATLSDQTKQRDIHERSISFRISTAPWPNTNTSEPGFFVAIPWRCFYFSTTKNNACITRTDAWIVANFRIPARPTLRNSSNRRFRYVKNGRWETVMTRETKLASFVRFCSLFLLDLVFPFGLVEERSKNEDCVSNIVNSSSDGI